MGINLFENGAAENLQPPAKPVAQVEVEKDLPRLPCAECDRKFVSEKELYRHQKSEHGYIPQFPCHLCGLTYSTKLQQENHIKTIHEGKSKEHSFTCWICLDNNVHKSYQKRSLLESHIKSVHKIPRNQIDFSKMSEAGNTDSNGATDNQSEDGNDTPAVKRLRLDGDENFLCAKCNFSCTERGEFQTHIAKHKRLEEDVLQCHECGISFTVQPSLKRHLFMVHKIRDFKRYQQESGLDLETPVVELPKPRPQRIPRGPLQNGYSSNESPKDSGSECEPMECTVCYKEFEDIAALRKHMRMHGMAFIRSRRLTPDAAMI